jgi:hypothetical protein
VTNIPEDLEFQDAGEMRPFDVTPGEESMLPLRFGAYSPTQQIALTRFMRLSMLRRDVLPLLEPTDWRARLIHKALYSTYRDCEELGLGDEVKLLRERTAATAS